MPRTTYNFTGTVTGRYSCTTGTTSAGVAFHRLTGIVGLDRLRTRECTVAIPCAETRNYAMQHDLSLLEAREALAHAPRVGKGGSAADTYTTFTRPARNQE